MDVMKNTLGVVDKDGNDAYTVSAMYNTKNFRIFDEVLGWEIGGDMPQAVACRLVMIACRHNHMALSCLLTMVEMY